MSRIDKYTSKGKKSEIYSDFFNDLTPHPDTKQLVRKTNEDSVKQAIRNLLLTNQYDRLFQPDIFSNIKKVLFEHISPQTTELLKTYITDVITNYEPRASIIEVFVKPSEHQQAYFITIVFFVLNNPTPVNLQVSLYRVR